MNTINWDNAKPNMFISSMNWKGTIIGITEEGKIWQWKYVNAMKQWLWVGITELGEDKVEDK